MSIPNIISIARLLATPITLYLILQSAFKPAFLLFVAAGVSDAVDGYIAKRWNQTTRLGAFLDPLADKVLLVGVYVALGVVGQLPTWLVILVVFRDVLIVGGVLLLLVLDTSSRVRPHFVSKANTALQLALAATVLADLAVSIDFSAISTVLIYVVSLTTLLSGAVYLVGWVRHVSSEEARR